MARILVADDEEDVADCIAEVARGEGHEVSVARDGREAAVRLGLSGVRPRDPLPDLLILDVRMPHLDGYTIFAMLQERRETRSIPLLVLTSKRDMADLFGSARARVAYMRKPFEPRSLVACIRELLS